MELKTKPVTRQSQDIKLVKGLLYSAFPKQELLPFWFLLWRAKRDGVDFLTFYDDEVFVGFTYLVTNENLTFILYLAIDSKSRSKGYGQMALEVIRLQHPGNRIILNIEAVEKDTVNFEQRTKRKSFYSKNGYKNTSMQLLEGDSKYEVLISNGDSTVDEYQLIYRKLTGPGLYWFFKPSIISFSSK